MSVKDRVIAKVMGREYVAAKTVDILPTEVVVDAALVGAYAEGYDQGMEDAMNEVDRIAETTLLKHIHNAALQLEQKIVNGDSTIVNPVGVLNAESENGCNPLPWDATREQAMFADDLEDELDTSLETVLNPDTRAIHFDPKFVEANKYWSNPPGQLSLEDARKAAKEYVSREVKQDIFTDADWDVTNDSQIAHDHVDQLTSTDNAWAEHRSVATHTVQPDDRLVAYELGISVQAYRHFNDQIKRVADINDYFLKIYEQRIEALEDRLILSKTAHK